jgi:deazaflavin-dependent oxidoreductase (nitroreductase family)
MGAVAGSRFATWLARRWIWSAVVWPLDRLLLRATGGVVSTGIALPTALLETRGVRSGLPRATAVLYFHDGERVTIVASKAGRPGNPAWFYNARANPDVMLGGEPYRARVVEDPAERDRLWLLADRVFPGFATYRRRAGREIPILQLDRR